MTIRTANSITLYRPATTAQVSALAAGDWQAFGHESLVAGCFYPMLHSSYARLVARQWNVRQYGEGFVLQCRVDARWLSQFTPHTVATPTHLEYCIAADLLPAFNAAMTDRIRIVQHYRQPMLPAARSFNRPALPTVTAPVPSSDWAFACTA